MNSILKGIINTMKKLLLIAILMLALVVAVVACDKTPDVTDTTAEDTTVETPTEEATTEETTEETTTEEETTEEATTEEETTEEVTTEEETTEEETTEEVTTEPDNTYEVDLSTVGATGNWPTVDNPVPGAVFGEEHCIALHYGSINLGEMDLSKYSKVTVTYATPDDATVPGASDQYNKTGKRVLLLNAPSASQGTFEYLPEESAIITSAQYQMSPASLTTTTVEIDLTEVDYNGQLYLTFDYRDADNGQAAEGFLVWVTGISFS